MLFHLCSPPLTVTNYLLSHCDFSIPLGFSESQSTEGKGKDNAKVHTTPSDSPHPSLYPCHAIPYVPMVYYTISNHTMSTHTICTVLYHTLPYNTICTVLYHTLPYHTCTIPPVTMSAPHTFSLPNKPAPGLSLSKMPQDTQPNPSLKSDHL